MKDYLQIAKKLQHESNDYLEGILVVGSIARGNNDSLSDYDFILIWEDKVSNKWPEGACRIEGIKCGIRNVSLKLLSQRQWSQIEKHSYSFAKIEYDKKEQIKELIYQKCVWESNERINLFCDLIFHASYIVNLTSNYRGCWNERDELNMAVIRNQPLLKLNLSLEYIKCLIQLAIISDYNFIPSEKVYLSDWIQNLSSTGHHIYELSKLHIDCLISGDILQLQTIFLDDIKKILAVFEEQETLPKNIMSYRNSIIRQK